MAELTHIPDGYQWTVPEAGLLLFFREVHSSSQGLMAEVEIFQDIAGERRQHYWSDLNLKAARSKTALAKLMAGRVPSYEQWETLIEMLCYLTAQEFRKPSDVFEIGHEEPPARTYRVAPLLAADEPTVFFGEGGSGKTWLALLLSMCIASGQPLAGLQPVAGKVLYIDYETNKETLERRIRMLARGMGISYPSLLYYRGGLPLAKDIASLKAHVLNNAISHVFIDSASLAVGGQLENVEAVGQFFSALRQLACGSTIITHTAKNGQEGKRTAFGSVYWTNLSRSVWEVLGNQEEGSNFLSIGIKHAKVNEEGKQPRLGFGVTFEADRVRFEARSVDSLPGLQQMHTALGQVIAAIGQFATGKATIRDIADTSGLGASTVEKTIQRNRTKFVRFQELGKKSFEYGIKSDVV